LLYEIAWQIDSDNHTIGNEFPQICDGQVIHTMFALDIVELTVTAVAGNNDCLCACGSYLLDFSSPIKDAFVIITGDQGTASAATTDLIHVGRR
jgi:hypothetical protein